MYLWAAGTFKLVLSSTLFNRGLRTWRFVCFCPLLVAKSLVVLIGWSIFYFYSLNCFLFFWHVKALYSWLYGFILIHFLSLYGRDLQLNISGWLRVSNIVAPSVTSLSHTFNKCTKLPIFELKWLDFIKLTCINIDTHFFV